jgi:hypothetical protein
MIHILCPQRFSLNDPKLSIPKLDNGRSCAQIEVFGSRDDELEKYGDSVERMSGLSEDLCKY